jgi:hypothetical protein
MAHQAPARTDYARSYLLFSEEPWCQGTIS